MASIASALFHILNRTTWNASNYLISSHGKNKNSADDCECINFADREKQVRIKPSHYVLNLITPSGETRRNDHTFITDLSYAQRKPKFRNRTDVRRRPVTPFESRCKCCHRFIKGELREHIHEIFTFAAPNLIDRSMCLKLWCTQLVLA